MGHRKHSQPRRGSLAYLPRGRAKSMEARIRGYARSYEGEPSMVVHCGFKAGCIQIVSIDDREKTPNAGKQLVSLGTVLVTPPVTVVGWRGYSKDANGHHAEFDVYADTLPRRITKKINLSTTDEKQKKSENLDNIERINAIIAVVPSDAGLEQKKPYIFEAPIEGGSIPDRAKYVQNLLGKTVRVSDLFQRGGSVDVAAITKGKGWQGVIKRYGAKRKQHKSRKSVRELGSLGPISPQYVMYTVPRAGQMGFHQRVEYNKRIMIMGDSKDGDYNINPPGGFKHFGNVQGDYIILRGSVPGAYRRLVKIRTQIRNAPKKIAEPRILEVVI
ncbi:MAG: 50S ribosomal protein L3 [Cenarchaeum sp. SB0665_bin_23]|nr:50S ribosomal protein L3 [Cenarchaeum sp. SB0665_bin_23]MYB46863.1 50S ribosomal protein L3 [Cenarchaeum sp. SB0662_bin_33]MYG33590.1 50S ribosomal protein L3 [Cenarchaeum sp. SB0677_bin_16]